MRFPGIFTCEALGLKKLKSKKVVHVPDVIFIGVYENNSFLILEMIPSVKASNNYFETMGQQLAALHRHTSTQFGLDHDNYIGLLQKENQQMK